MNRFTADYSSSPAETPPRRRKDLFFNEPNIASTTPLVPPPSTVFGSSRFGSGQNLFQKQTPSTTGKTSRHTPPSQREKRTSPRRRQFNTTFASSTIPDADEADAFEYDQPLPAQSLMKFSANSHRTSTRSAFRKSTTTQRDNLQEGKPDQLPSLARNLVSRATPAPLEKDDELILNTELFLQQMNGEKEHAIDDDSLGSLLDIQARDLLNLWRGHADLSNTISTDIGPPPSAPGFDKAYYLSSLLLLLHHPGETPIPSALLTWLNNNHLSYEHVTRSVVNKSPNPAAHDNFWDAVLSLTLRGRLQDAVRLLGEADFQYAATAVDDGEAESGYHGAQLQTIQGVIFRARQVINSCPGIEGKWDTSSDIWSIYRANVTNELEKAAQLASVEEGDEDDFEAANFGIRKPQRDLLRKSQRSRNLPRSIYSGINILYGILVGSYDEIVQQSQDWLEAVCGLTVWWNINADSQVAKWRLGVSRETTRTSTTTQHHLYLVRLHDAFLSVTDPDGKDAFAVNGLSPVEVALGCALQGQISSFLSVTQLLSQCVAAAIAELASVAGWLRETSQPGLNQSDLLVLNFGSAQGEVTKDDVLMSYVAALFGRDEMVMADGAVIEGWEVALSVASRLDDESMKDDIVKDLLDNLDVADQGRMERVINLCTDLRFMDHARAMSENLGDHLAHNTTQYGVALLCYAKSHSRARIQQLIEMLISYCLVQSRAYPPAEEIDEALLALVEAPKVAFADIIDTDPEAASMLQFYMVGYACVRRIFTLRDDSGWTVKAAGPIMQGTYGRKRAAAKALVAAINSAADSIYGGLYDVERQTAVQVDALMPLLGEATGFVGRDSRAFTNDQMYALLAAVEDLQTVNTRVREATEACLIASVAEYKGNEPPSPRQMLKKSISSGTNSNFSFSMMGSEMFGSGTTGGGKSDGSAVLVGGKKGETVHRSWDWRQQFKDVPNEELAGEVIKRLRLAVAKELSFAELES